MNDGLDHTTVVISPGHPHLDCGDKICIDPGGQELTKTATDKCPGCAEKQCDNYTTDPRCTGITDLGDFNTLKLIE